MCVGTSKQTIDMSRKTGCLVRLYGRTKADQDSSGRIIVRLSKFIHRRLSDGLKLLVQVRLTVGL